MLSDMYLGNNIESYLQAAGIFLAVTIGLAIIQKLITARLVYLSRKTTTNIDDAVIEIVKSLKPQFYFAIALLAAFSTLRSDQTAKEVVRFIVIFLATWQAIHALQVLIDYIAQKYSTRNTNGDSSTTAITTLGKIMKIVVWILGGLVIIQNLGVNVTSLVAGLGIGGVAVALAAQNILGDLFSSFAIIFDKPFKVGDFIQIGDYMGEVKRIGIKTTRIQSLQGEEVIIGNQELTSSKIQNFGRLSKRRVVFTLGVEYETDRKQLKSIPKYVREIIKKQDKATVDRVTLSKFADSAIQFECVYFITSDDYNFYMRTQEDINLAILEKFDKEKIAMAYPTQVVYVKK